jgi:hypothetical protein
VVTRHVQHQHSWLHCVSSSHSFIHSSFASIINHIFTLHLSRTLHYAYNHELLFSFDQQTFGLHITERGSPYDTADELKRFLKIHRQLKSAYEHEDTNFDMDASEDFLVTVSYHQKVLAQFNFVTKKLQTGLLTLSEGRKLLDGLVDFTEHANQANVGHIMY